MSKTFALLAALLITTATVAAPASAGRDLAQEFRTGVNLGGK